VERETQKVSTRFQLPFVEIVIGSSGVKPADSTSLKALIEDTQDVEV
jgi:hypothetical protein